MGHKNMKKQQKTETLQNTTEPSPFLDKNMISANKIMRNEANLNSQKFTATPYNIGGYNDSHPKTQNGTKPNEANFFTTSNPIFVRNFGSGQGVSLRPSEVVRVVRRAMDDWLTTPPGAKRTTKNTIGELFSLEI